MNWDREEVSRLLDAKITDDTSADGDCVSIVRFKDTRSLYELWISAESVFLAAGPELPIQGLPWFEISIPCAQLALIPRSGMPTGVGIYSGPIGPGTLCFSITRRDDGNISLSGAWDGLVGPQRHRTE